MPRPYNMTDTEMKGWLETQYDVNENGCWVWRGCKSRKGYGQVGWKGAVRDVHRLYWLLSGRIISDKLELCHGNGCSRACFNPAHLTLGDKRKNQLDRHRDDTMFVAKVTPQQILEIRARADKSQRELAKEYGMSDSQMSRIISRKSWSWI
jgi:hypothetical protein